MIGFERAGVTLGGGAVEQRLEHLDGLGLLLSRVLRYGRLRVRIGLSSYPCREQSTECIPRPLVAWCCLCEYGAWMVLTKLRVTLGLPNATMAE